jgi:exopolyphosphatase/guanosine-5'-triphosphate,3'-diphosphate pyrophosphatase
VRLEVRPGVRVPDSDAVHARLRQLARVAGVPGAEIVTVE